MSTQQTSWWLPWMLILLALAMILGSFYYGGSTLGLPMAIGVAVGAAAVWSRRTRA